MLKKLLTVAFAIVALAGLTQTSQAQYVYLDANGDGVWSSADRLNANGTPTTVDAWINTNHNKGGSLALCDTGDGDLGFWNSYAVNVGATGGTVTFTNFVNQQSTFTLACVGVGIDFQSNNTEMTACRATPTSQAAGLQRMFTVTVTAQTGTPTLDYLALGSLSPNFTSFGTPCSGNDFDNTYKLGSDFFDHDGLAAAGGNRQPTITVPATVNGSENSPVSVTASASDPDAGQVVTLSQTNNAPFLSGPASVGPSANPSITLTGTPSFAQAGTYTVNWTATDNFVVPTSSTATTSVVIANVDRAPVVTAPATVSGIETTPINFTVSASDPDGEPLNALTLVGSPNPNGATFTAGVGNTTGTFSWTPSATQAGTYNLTFMASNSLSGTARTVLTVANFDGSPVVTAPATATFTTNIAGTITVTASDPDGEAITSLTESSSPGTVGSTFTANGTKTSGTFAWTPGGPDAGDYMLTFTASNALSGTAGTALHVTFNDQPPVVTAPATASGAENTLITFSISASDPDGQPVTSLFYNSNPPTTGATFAINASHTSATWSWTPNFSNQGTYFVDFTASNTLSVTARTTVTVTNVDRPPTVTAPATQTVNEGSLLSFLVTANDPDADAFTSLTSASSPATTGSTFTVNAFKNQGGFEWTPSFTQAGSYTATFTAVANGVSATASTAITVNNVNRAPVVTAPLSQSVSEGSPLTFTVTAIDPDGDPVTFLTASSSPPTTGSSFTTNASNTSGTFSWTPNSTQAGTYQVTFTASDGTLNSFGITMITVNNSNRNPTVTAPASQTTNEGVLLSFAVTATDPDGDHVTLTMLAGSPTGSSFVDNGDNTGTFSWSPGFNQAGGYSVTFHGNDGQGGTANATTAITVNNVDRTPVADAGGPYAGLTNVPLPFNGSASSDPDGDGLSYMWDFGDGGSGTGVTPVHVYAMAGVYNVTLTVSSGSLSDTDATTAQIQDTLPARAFTSGGNNKTSLGAGKPFTCFHVEAVGGSFDNSQVQIATIRMIYPPGSSNMIFASGKTGIDGDKDGNGVTEITACFSKTDMRVLFAGLPSGSNNVTIEIKGDLAGGGSFSATLQHTVKSNGSFLAASISPNPLNPRAKLSFTTTRPGAVRVQMFDPQGRLVKTVADEPMAMAGYHDYTIDGRSQSGTKLASGVYFVKVWSEHDGDQVTRITILK